MSEISKERIERAAKRLYLKFWDEHPDQPKYEDMANEYTECYREWACAALEADAPAISDDHKAEAREIVGLSDNSKSSWRHGYAKKIAAALASAEARGKIEGLKEAQQIIRDLPSEVAYHLIDGRIASLSIASE